VDRGGLNKRLLDELESMPNVKLLFNHKLTGADFRKKVAWFEQRRITSSSQARPDEIEVKFNFLIGADGAHSAARYHLMKFTRMNYQQEYIDTLWCEFTIPPVENYDKNVPKSQFRMSPHHLHIWPGKEFMFIAIPSLVSTHHE
jgi:kynurenine 3-monooxygenase